MSAHQTQGVVLDVVDENARAMWAPLAELVRPLVELACGVGHRYVVLAVHGNKLVHAATASRIGDAHAAMRLAHQVLDEFKPDGGTTPWLIAVRPSAAARIAEGLPRVH